MFVTKIDGISKYFYLKHEREIEGSSIEGEAWLLQEFLEFYLK